MRADEDIRRLHGPGEQQSKLTGREQLLDVFRIKKFPFVSWGVACSVLAVDAKKDSMHNAPSIVAQ